MTDFYKLTVRGRARRLRRVALAALRHYDLDVTRVRLVTNDMNGIFRVDTADGAKRILRVCRADGLAHSLAEIRSEAAWLHALARDTDLLIPAPLPTREGDFVVTVAAPGVPEPRHCIVFSWVPGRTISKQMTGEAIAQWGALTAALHEHAAAFQPPPDFSIPSYDKVFPFNEPITLFDEANRELLPPARRAVFEAVLAKVQEAVDRLKASGEPMRVLHGDLHQWNVNVHRGRAGAFDFEDLMWGWPVQDIATMLFYSHGEARYGAVREAFRRGYTSRRAWPEQIPGEMDTFIAGRGLVLANDILLDTDPEWRAVVPRFFARTEARLRALLAGGAFDIKDWPLFDRE